MMQPRGSMYDVKRIGPEREHKEVLSFLKTKKKPLKKEKKTKTGQTDVISLKATEKQYNLLHRCKITNIQYSLHSLFPTAPCLCICSTSINLIYLYIWEQPQQRQHYGTGQLDKYINHGDSTAHAFYESPYIYFLQNTQINTITGDIKVLRLDIAPLTYVSHELVGSHLSLMNPSGKHKGEIYLMYF